MRKIIKRTLCVLSATMCVLGTAATASADTVSFNVTIPGDPILLCSKESGYRTEILCNRNIV